MPTVIDSLIVTLGIDPSGFTEGQRQMAQNLRQMEDLANRSVQRIERSGSGIVTFFRSIDHPIASIRQHFEQLATVTATPQQNLINLAQQGRRTGQEVEAGALQGAVGLRALGVAGLTAVAAFVALDKVRSSATDTARNLFGASVGAAGAGVPIQEYTAISQALLHGGNVPETETQGWLSQIRSAQVQAQHGDPAQAAALAVNLAKIGVNANAFTDSPEQIMLAVAERFHSVSADVAIGLGDMVGQSAALSLALHNLGTAGLEEQIQLERQRAATDAQTQAAKDLTLAQANLDVAWQNLERTIGEKIDPALTVFDNNLAALLDTLSGAKTGAFALNNSVPNSPADAKPSWWRRALEWTGLIPTIGDTSNLPKPGAAPASSGLSLSPGSLLNIPVEAAAAATIIGQRESRMQNIRNYRYDSTHTAQGYYQITDTNWRIYAPQLGITTAHAMDSSFEDQTRVFALMYQKEGYHPWDAAHGGSIASDRDFYAQLGAQVSLIQSARAGGSTTNHTVSNDVDVNGGIHIYGANTNNGYQTGGAISDAIQAQLLTNQINTGQQ